MSDNVLQLDHITMQFGGVVAVNDLNLEVNQGEIVALIGPNGAGKTTAAGWCSWESPSWRTIRRGR
jgi:branched-chain amino acid transport system ATP-binding protein